MTTRQALYVSGLDVSFGNFAVLKNLSWTVDFGEVRGVIGPNGAGKTTLLDSLTGKTRYQSGDIYVCLLYTSPSPRDGLLSRMPSSA